MSWQPWDGAFNLFDLGGVVTPSGATKGGAVFRSGRRERLTEEGWARARRDGLATIVDLRNTAEIGRREHDPVVEDAATQGILIVHAPTENPDDAEFMRVCGPWLDHPRSYADNIRFYPEKFRAVFEAIARSRGPVLVHCSGGRDRTGLVSAILLSLAGAAPEAVADDYERSFREAWVYQSHHPELVHEPVRSAGEMDARVAERRAALVAWLDGFDARVWLWDIGVSAADVEALARILH